MPESKLVLTFGSIVVTPTQFEKLDRVKAEYFQAERSPNSTPYVQGAPTDAGYIWTVSARVSPDELDYLDLMERASERYWQNPNPSSDGAILVYDYARLFREPAPRSRALAPGGTVENIVNGVTTVGVKYPAQYYALLSNLTDLTEQFNCRVDFTLTELGRVPA